MTSRSPAMPFLLDSSDEDDDDDDVASDLHPSQVLEPAGPVFDQVLANAITSAAASAASTSTSYNRWLNDISGHQPEGEEFYGTPAFFAPPLLPSASPEVEDPLPGSIPPWQHYGLGVRPHWWHYWEERHADAIFAGQAGARRMEPGSSRIMFAP